jgi:hypothetical protein
LRRAFRNLKAHAKARRKAFRLTFSEFEEVAVSGGYATGRGRSRDGLTIDRIDSRKGYEPTNIRVLTNSENARLARWEQLGMQPGDADETGVDGRELNWEDAA